MSFSRTGFRVIAFGGCTAANKAPAKICHYASNETLATIVAANFFDDLVDELAVGDTIKISADLDGTPDCAEVMVATNDGTHITVKTFDASITIDDLNGLFELAANKVIKVNAGGTSFELADDATG